MTAHSALVVLSCLHSVGATPRQSWFTLTTTPTKVKSCCSQLLFTLVHHRPHALLLTGEGQN